MGVDIICAIAFMVIPALNLDKIKYAKITPIYNMLLKY